MKIAIEARSLSGQGSGIRTYTYQLISHLLQNDTDNEYHLIYSSPEVRALFQRAHEHSVQLRHESLFYPWLWWQVPRLLQTIAPDVVHFTKADVPLAPRWPTVVTVYDIIPLLLPQSQSFARRWYWRMALRHAAHASSHIITISERSKIDMVERFGIDLSRITVIPLAADLDHFKPRSVGGAVSLSIKYQFKMPYVLFVGRQEMRKNILLLLRAFARIARDIPHHLLIVGKEDTVSAELNKTILRLPDSLAQRIRLINFVPEADLPILYSATDLFVWPSIYEGWGLPALEAMACGAPVLVSDGGALPEVVGSAGIIVPFSTSKLAARTHDGAFEEALAERMLTILTDRSLRDSMRAAGLKRVQQFSWDRVTEATRDVYQMVAEKGRG